jgi:hypothetical protein
MIKVKSEKLDAYIKINIEHIKPTAKESMIISFTKKELFANAFDYDFIKARIKPFLSKCKSKEYCTAINACLDEIRKYKTLCLENDSILAMKKY